MAIELVTGRAGVPHVDSEDVGAFNAHSLGSGAYIMSGCEVTAKSANSVNIAAGEILWEGRHIRVKGSGESLAVDNGQTGYNRRDLITLNYAKDSNGIESVSFAVVKGTATTGTAADPSVKVGSILAGDTSAVIPFARITLSGLSVATPTVLLGSLPSLVSLRDSVSLIDGWYVYGINGIKVAIKEVSVTVSISWLYIDSIYGGDMQSAKLPDGVFSAAPACSASIAQASATCWIAPTTNSIPTKTETQRFRVLSSSKETITLRAMITAVGV